MNSEGPAGVAALTDDLAALGYRVMSEEGGAWPGAAITFVIERRAPEPPAGADPQAP